MSVSGVLFELRSWVRMLLPGKYVAPYYPTADRIIDRMMVLAQVHKDDVVYDLGCGDARILVRAAKGFGARGVGVELDPALVSAARERIQKAGVENKVQIIQGDASAQDVREATVITLYTSDWGGDYLVQKLSPTIKRGTRVVSFHFPLRGWKSHLRKTDVALNVQLFLYESP